MRRHLGSSPYTGEAARPPSTWVIPACAALVVLLVVLGSSMMSATSGAGARSGMAEPAVSPAVPVTHGDLVVTAGETYTIRPTGGVPTYYQGGNITVLAGGTLNVQNVTLTFVQFVSNVGTPIQRLSHIFTFSDFGTVNFYNSTVTTDMGVINAYAKLNVVVSGSMTLWKSVFAFPGWVTVSGSAGNLTLNDSGITGNPVIPFLSEPVVIQGDTEYAASLLVTGGAHLNLFDSVVSDTYADDTLLTGIPGPAPLGVGPTAIKAGGANITDLQTPTDSANLSLDWLYYATGISGGYVLATYNDSNSAPSTVAVEVWYEGIAYSIGDFQFVNNTTGGVLVLPIPAGLVNAINAGGMLAYLNNTGDFGLPSQIALNFSAPSGPSVSVFAAQIVLDPALQYNMVATGSGTTVSSVDSSLDLTWNTPPASPVSQASPYPWLSNKFMFEDGATGYLANVSVPSAIPGVFSTSAFLTDSSSAVNLYRWAQFNITNLSSTGVEPVSGAAANAYYAYNDNQASNATATALNDLKSTNPAIWSYLQYWDQQHGVSRYGLSNITGQASLLLAAGTLNSTNLPSGTFLGGYHVGFRVPYINNATWISTAVSPYPTGTAYGTAGYTAADLTNVRVPIAPPEVTFVSYQTPAQGPLDVNNQYSSEGVLFLNGPGTAVITVSATPVGGGTAIPIAEDPAATNGSFHFDWGPLSGGVLTPGTTYTISAEANYKTATPAVYNFPGTYSVPATTSATSFLLQKFLGLPLWVWLAIAAAAVVAILAVLLLFRRQAAGKLVECGECGELIPEDATVCPKCGAEFESELVRCSRCSSTIPADSQFCPECSAQLLGKPGEGASDPERQAYADFTEKFRAEGKKELGDNYTESSFWDWWKRQPSYVPFSQWKVQQNKGAPRAGMSEPPVGSGVIAADAPQKGGAAARPPPAPAAPAPAPGAGPGFTAPPPAMGAQPAGASSALKPCPNCAKEIPPEYLVCPFCGAVTQ